MLFGGFWLQPSKKHGTFGCFGNSIFLAENVKSFFGGKHICFFGSCLEGFWSWAPFWFLFWVNLFQGSFLGSRLPFGKLWSLLWFPWGVAWGFPLHWFPVRVVLAVIFLLSLPFTASKTVWSLEQLGWVVSGLLCVESQGGLWGQFHSTTQHFNDQFIFCFSLAPSGTTQHPLVQSFQEKGMIAHVGEKQEAQIFLESCWFGSKRGRVALAPYGCCIPF